MCVKQIWVSQPRVWEGVVLLPKYLGARDTSDKTAQALLDLPLPQLQVGGTTTDGGKKGGRLCHRGRPSPLVSV